VCRLLHGDGVSESCDLGMRRIGSACTIRLRSRRRRTYLDAGRDEFLLDLGAQAVANELTRLGVKHSLELFDGTHSGTAHRYPAAIRELVRALDKR
jgi:hypothetical protein